MPTGRGIAVPIAVACGIMLAGDAAAYRYTITAPVEKGQTPAVAAAPLRKEEAQIRVENAKVYSERIFVEGTRDPDRRMPPPRSVEQKFAEALNEGNPEVAGGWMRHGMFYDGVFYWGRDPLSFVYYNVKGAMLDAAQ